MSRITVTASNSMSEIQNALNKYDIITFKKGTYKITKTLNIPSNRTIYLEDAVLRRYCSKPVLITEVNKNTKAYNGAHDIKVIGGTIEGMNGSSYKYSASNMVLLFHAKNVSFINVTFLDNTGSHAIDIGGCKDVYIEGCKFLGYCSVGKDFREAIQIDYAYQGGIPYFAEGSACFDDTHCDGVNIIGCVFDKSPTYKSQFVAIGTHAQTNSNNYHKNINIKYNTAKGNGVSASGSYGFFFRAVNMRNVNIIGNVVDNYGRFVFIDHNPKTSCKSNKASRNILISDNVVLGSDDRFKASSIYVNSVDIHKSSDITITNNIYDKATSVTCTKVTNLTNTNNKIK